MNHIDTGFKSCSTDIYNITKNLISADLQNTVLGAFMVENSENQCKPNCHFKKHPVLLTSSDSDLSEKVPTCNGYQTRRRVLDSNSNDQIYNVHFKEQYYKYTSRQAETPDRNLLNLCNSQIDFVHKSSSNLKLRNQIVSKSAPHLHNHVEIKQHQLEKKLFHFLQKTITCLDNISVSLSKEIVLPDGQEDWQRRRVRNVEFSSRFQRNYVYQLGRQIIELQKAIRNTNDNRPTKSVSQCIVTAHQTLLQAFQSYNSHIPACLGNLAVDKLEVVIDHGKNLMTVHRELLDSDDEEACRKINIFESILVRCSTVLKKATDVMADPTKNLPSKKSSIKTICSANKHSKNKRMESKFSMYSFPTTLRRRNMSKRAFGIAKKLKSANYIHSKYKTAGFKHRPPLEKDKTQLKDKTFPKKPCPGDTPLPTPKNDDDVKTMIAVIKEKEEKEQANNKTKSLAENLQCLMPLVKSICERIMASSSDVVNQEQLESVLKGMLDVTLHGTINKENRTNAEGRKNGFKHDDFVKIRKLESKLISATKKHLTFEDDYLRSNNWETVSVTGERNAQLICIRDNRSTPEITLHPPYPSLATIVPDDDDLQSFEMPNVKLHTIKISRLPKTPLRAVTPLAKNKIKSILQGKLQHTKYLKGNPMYCKTANRHPWQIVSQISESLLTEVLLSVAREVQVADILESLYNSEFQ